ncbi:hypothetical protein B0H14DRAFT_2812534 [Mycena olivaceomarginata]|nr:hypothetical protein B0H14DRAFT_2812534 [Mycena olivaceomarginata]
MNTQLVQENMDTMETALEEMCQNWLIALLGVVELLPHNQWYSMVEIHRQYMDCLAAMEQEAARQAGYTHSPMTQRSYRSMTTEFRVTLQLLIDSILQENSSFQIPSRIQFRLAKTLGRLHNGPVESRVIFHGSRCRTTLSLVLLRRCFITETRLFYLGRTSAGSKLPSSGN